MGAITTGQQDLPPAERPGSDTSEFKLAVLSAAISLILICLGIFVPDQGDLKVLGVSLLGVTSTGYGLNRTLLKRKSISNADGQ